VTVDVRQMVSERRFGLLLGLVVTVLLALVVLASNASVPRGAAPSVAHSGAPSQAGGALLAIFVALLVVSAALAGVLVYSLGGSRRGKKDPDDAEWVHEPPPAGWLEKVLGILVPMALLAGLVVALVYAARTGHPQATQTTRTPITAPPSTSAPASAPVAPGGGPGDLWLIVGAAAGGAVIIAAAIAFLLVPRLRRPAPTIADEAQTRQRAVVTHAVSLSLEDLRRERDPRRAIVAAYARMEAAFTAAGLARPLQETATEYMRRILAGERAPAVPLFELTQLFQEAKFSQHELTASHRASALEALTVIREAIAA
jgi:hypothetical protein